MSIYEKLAPELAAHTEAWKHTWIGLPASDISSVVVDAENDFLVSLVKPDGTQLPVFLKRTHLVDPLNYMEGDIVAPLDGGLPAPSDLWRRALHKVNDAHNEAYVDALFALEADRLVATNISPHWCRCYGVLTARVERYMFNITSEYDSIRRKPWWRRNQALGGLKYLDLNCGSAARESGEVTPAGTVEAARTHDMTADDFVDCDSPDADIVPVNTLSDEISDTEPALAPDEPVTLQMPKLKLKRLPTTPDRSDTSDDEDDEEDDDSEVVDEKYVTFNDFPVVVSFLEKATGTMDDLLDQENEDDELLNSTKEERWTAWLFQVIVALCEAQHYFGFVHNDLHTNNIMWVGTGITHLYYKLVDKSEKVIRYMKVPTYGRIMKIIDFGRATYHLPDPCGFVISDAFYPGNDAATQYNCEPFYDSAEGKRVEPNRSFDLCRLAVGMLESLYPEVPAAATPIVIMSREDKKMYPKTVSGVYNMMWGWLTDDNGRNVLRTPNGKERYPDFDLYRALAADVHSAVPRVVARDPLFMPFAFIDDMPKGEQVYTVHI